MFVDDARRWSPHARAGRGSTERAPRALAFLGDASTLDAVVAGWYAHGTAAQQARFLATVGVIAGDAMVAPTREAVRSSKVKTAAAAWLAERALAPPPPPRTPGAVDLDTLAWCDSDAFEFGFALVAEATAERFRGEEDDHTALMVSADPTSTDRVRRHRARRRGGGVLPRTADQAIARTPEGALVVHGGEATRDELAAAVAGAAARDWLPVTTLELPDGRLVGLGAQTTLAAARGCGELLELALAPGRYDVHHARGDDGDDDGYLRRSCGSRGSSSLLAARHADEWRPSSTVEVRLHPDTSSDGAVSSSSVQLRVGCSQAAETCP